MGLLEFTEDELLKAQKGLDAAGVTLPNFKNVSRELAKEPTPEPEETEDQRIDRELHECIPIIVNIQSMMRGVRVRDRFRRMKNRLRRAERGVIGLQSLVRGQTVRMVFDDHLKDYRASMDWAMKVVPP